MKFRTATFKIDSKLVDEFVDAFDGNAVHKPGNSNEILPVNTVPGLMVVSLAAKEVLRLPEYREILCARAFRIKFQSPVFRDDELYVRGTFRDSPHKQRTGVIFRENDCEVVNAKTQQAVIHYEITQLLRG